ncbi:MAG TPA: hypothetical protein VNK04_17020 [Gemmataceae bacterium]|nr:hypothetical protein [Gemmataceae bacterium]
MTTELTSTLSGLVERIVGLARQDPQLRDELRRLAEAILTVTRVDPDRSGPAATGDATTAPVLPAVLAESPPPPPVPPSLPRREGPVVPEPVTPPQAESPRVWAARWTPPVQADLPIIEARCRLKAEAARWAAMRRRRLAEGADFRTEIEPKDRELIARAKELPDCFLWMCHPSGPSPADPSWYLTVAGCFEAVAEGLALVRGLLDSPDPLPEEFGQSLDLLAEAQSALRTAVLRMDDQTDPDQTRVFNWLRITANENQVFIPRHMRTDDPADPTRWADLLARIDAVDARLREIQKKTRVRKKLFGKLRHKVSLVESEPENAIENWRALAATVDELISSGVPPSNTQIRELLLPVIEEMPELGDLPRGFQLVLREIDRFLAACPTPESPTVIEEPAPVVREAARLLEGRSIVLIGGERRPAACEALRRGLGLRELIWIETREHQSIDGFEPYIARPEVALVVLAIRWSSHSFGDVKEFCDRHGKPLVRLPGGYNINQVAAQIMAQCSQRLRCI